MYLEKLDRVIIGVSAIATVGMLLGMAATARAESADAAISEEYIRYCEDAGGRYNICPELLEAIIEQESGGNPDAIGQAGEVGLMQIYPKYHRERMGRLDIYSLYDPEGNILVGADYLSELFREYEDIGTVLMVYNGSKDAIQRVDRADYTDYALKIMKCTEQLERMHGK